MPNIEDMDPNQPILPISVAANILGIKARMLRFYEERGIIAPMRSSGNRRLYSKKDLDILAYVQYLTIVKGVNVSGVLEIQRILRRMKQATREAFMEEIRREINSLPDTEKQRYRGDLSNRNTEILEIETLDPKQIKEALEPPPVDPETLGNP